jgi:reactive intermediate/imine deaminase
MTARIFVVAAIAFAAGWTANLPAQQGRQYFGGRTPGNPAVAPYNDGVLVNGTLYLAGKIGLLPDRTVPATADEEARLVLTDVKTTLEAAGMTMDDLVSVQVFASNTADYDAFNKVYRTFFTREFPARAFVGAGPLLFGARFEVQGIAVKR